MIAHRLAWRFVRTRSPEHRWRRVVVPFAGGLVALVLLSSLSLIHMAERQDHRYDNRRPWVEESGEPHPTDLWAVGRGDELAGEHIHVEWIQPVDPSAEKIYPPGVGYLPPGESAYSPALIRLISDHPETAASFFGTNGLNAGFVVIGDEGLQHADELLVYRRVPDEVDLSKNFFAVRFVDYGKNQSGQLPAGGIGFRLDVNSSNMPQAVLAFLVLPGLVVSYLALSAGSGMRDRRFALLRLLGASRRQYVTLALLEGLLLALPGLVAGLLIWWFASRMLSELPLLDHGVIVGRPFQQGDLELPASWVILALVGSVLALCLGLSASAWLTYGARSQSVHVSTRASISFWRLAPLSLVALGIGAQVWIGGEPGAGIFLLSAMATLALLPLMLPQVIRPLGTAIARIPGLPFRLAGRGIEHDAIRVSRPVLSAAVIVAMALGAVGFWAIIHTAIPPAPERTEIPAVMINYTSVDQPAEIATLSSALPDALVLRADGASEPVRLAATCDQFVPWFPGTACDAQNPRMLSGDLAEKLAVAITGGPHGNVVLVPPEEIETNSFLAVIGRGEYTPFVESTHAAARQYLLLAVINDNDGVSEAVMSAKWLAAGIRVAVLLLALGVVVAMVDRFIDIRGHRRGLLRIGLVPRQLGQLDALQFLITSVAAVAAGALLGVLTVLRVLQAYQETPTPWSDMRMVISAAIGTALAMVILVFVVGTNRYRHRA